MIRLSGRRRVLISVVTAAVTLAALIVVPLLWSRTEADRDHGESGSVSVADFLKEHPEFRNHRSMALAFISEKMRQSGGEGTEEIVSGPEQEQYDNRAFPHPVIGNAQVTGSRAAFQAADARTRQPATASGWQPLGPSTGTVPGVVTYTGTPTVVSGRVTALAFAGPCTASSCVLYLGSAGGGLWRTRDALAGTPTWTPVGADIPSTAIGSLTVAPDGTLYVGTGEPNGSSDSEAGRGLWRSTDGGATFSQVYTFAGSTDVTLNRSVAVLTVDPRDARHLLMGTAVARHGSSSVNGGRYTPPGAAALGLYESTDGGAHWALSLTEPSDVVNPGSPTGDDYFRGDVTNIQLDPGDPNTVYAAVSSYGLFRRAGSGPWQQVYTTPLSGNQAISQANRIEFAAVRLPDGHTRIYLGDGTLYGSAATGFVSGLLRTDDATAATPAWSTLSSATRGTPGYGSYNFCETQCEYDMAVVSPPGHPDTVFLSGSMNYNEVFVANRPSNGRAVVRSTDGGVHVTDMTNDVASAPNGLHPDHHALAFVPGDPNGAFVTGSDGGVVRQSGPFVDASTGCDSRGLSGADLTDCRAWLSAVPTANTQINAGLSTLQYQSVSVSPDGKLLQGGTQDNGTWESDGASGWVESVGGDGGQSGFDAKNSQIRYHSYYSPSHDVNFHGSDPTGWDYISDPLTASGEGASFYVPLTADPVNAGFVFDGLQHVWRTTDHGGAPDYLQKYCNELTGQVDPDHPCGDWVALGGANGDLSSAAWGNDNAGAANYVVSIVRPASDRNTMWAATRRGRLFVSGNADAKDPASVRYTRLDTTLGLPARFVSGVAVDPADPYHVWISYSGYSAYATGGHVYEVRYDPRTKHATARDLSLDLGDQPVTGIARVPGTGTLYAGTDYGVLTLPRGGSSWTTTKGLPKVAVYGLTPDPRRHLLYAATHGRGLYRLSVG